MTYEAKTKEAVIITILSFFRNPMIPITIFNKNIRGTDTIINTSTPDWLNINSTILVIMSIFAFSEMVFILFQVNSFNRLFFPGFPLYVLFCFYDFF